MAVKIRLKITGKRNNRTYRVVAVDESKKRDGRVIEELGWVNPQLKSQKHKLNLDRINHWLTLGAQPTLAVKSMLKSS